MSRVCGNCGKEYDPEEHTWSAGYGCDWYCSKKCCDAAWYRQGTDSPPPSCPCY